ncbi:MAG: BadF/BadG/BcrA/BcrD ATPase family protein, partial [Pseudomonadota bacterium]
MRSDGWSTDGPVLLVDGGGTKTRAVLVGDDDQPLGEGRAGPSNLMLGTRNARAEVEVACGKAIIALGPTDALPTELPLCCAMAGAGNRHLCEAFSADGKRPAILVSDAYAAMVGALGGEPGVGIVVGTGSAAFCLAEDGSVREAGGWGPAIGDEGSGAWIGRAALSLAAKIIDGQSDSLLNGSSRSDLLAFVERRVSATGRTRTTLLEWVREASPADFAKLSPAILDDATSGNT